MFTSELKQFGWTPSALDECVYRLYDLDTLELARVLCAHVYDVVTGGVGAAFWKSTDKLRQRFPVRKWKRNNGEICGSIISQDRNSRDIFMTQRACTLD